jgi:thiol-disulfide isomerase/thioredoxin
MNICRMLPLVLAALSSFSLLRAEVNVEMAKKLFSAQASLEDFNKAVEEAKKADAPAQLLAEAKLVWGLRHKDTEFLSKILPELEAAVSGFKKEDSAGLGSVEDFKALISYIKALEAAGKGDESALKEHITEAFWLSPEQAGLFAETITYFRTQAKMAKITVDMKLPITNSKAEATTLGDVLAGKKAVLLDFWASWCTPCMQLMPELRKKAEYLGKHGVVVAGMNTESDEAIADKVRGEKAMKDVTWLVEPKARPFSDPMEITSIPRMILLSPEGKVLFNGHPQDAALWTALKKVDATIEPMKEE